MASLLEEILSEPVNTSSGGSKRVSSSVRTKANPEGTGGVINALRTNTAEISEAKDKLNNINEIVGRSFQELTEATAKGTVKGYEGELTTIEGEAQRQKALLKAQHTDQKVAEQVDWENHLIATMGEIKQHKAEQAAKLKTIQEWNTSANPLTHIAGLVAIPFMRQQAEDSENLANEKIEELEKMNTLMQSSSKTTASIQTRVTEATSAAAISGLAADQQADALKMKITALQTSAGQINDILKLSGAQVNNSVQEYNIGVQEEQRAASAQQREFMNEQRKKAGKEEDATNQAIDMINLALDSIGKDRIPDNMRPLVGDQLNKSGQAGEDLRALFAKGFDLTFNGGKLQHGDSPVEATRFRERFGIAPKTPEEQRIIGTVEGLMGSHPAVQAAKPNEKATVANQVVKAKLEHDETNISIDANSLTPPMSWATMAATDAIRVLPVWEKLIAPQITDNMSPMAVDPKDLHSRLTAGISTGQTTIPEAAKLYQLWGQQSRNLNNVALAKTTGYQQKKFVARVSQPRTKSDWLKIGPSEVPYNKMLNAGISLLPYVDVPIDVDNINEIMDSFAASHSGKLREVGAKAGSVPKPAGKIAGSTGVK